MNDNQKRMLHAKAIEFKTSGQQQRVGMDWIESFLGNAHIDSDNEGWNESVDSDSDSDESELVISDDESDDESELVISSDEEDEDVCG